MGARVRAILIVLLLGAVAWTQPIAAQGGGPQLVDIQTADLRTDGNPVPNGRLDTLRLTFNAPVDEDTFHVADFAVTGRVLLGYEQVLPDEIHLFVKEVSHDTEAVPAVTMTSGRIRGTGGAEAGQATTTTTDGAPPMIIAASASVGSDQVRIQFSEPIAGAIQSTDLNYNGGGSGATGITSVVHTAGTDSAVLTLDAAVTGGDLGVDTISPASNIADAAGNAALPATVAVQAPRLVQVRADIGSTTVVARFNTAVQAAGSIGASAFDVVYDVSPADPITGVASVQHTSGDHDVVIELLDAVGRDDVRSLEPALLTLAADQLTDQDGRKVAFARVPFVDVTAPQPIGVATLDRNRNGFLDAVSIFWSEPVDPVCNDGLEVEGYELDVTSAQNIILSPDGKVATIPVKERSTFDPDTGFIPSVLSGACTGGQQPWKDRADPANVAQPIRPGSLDEVDGANPAIVQGTTVDADSDGRLDGYSLDFSEAMDATVFAPADWQVVGHKVLGGTWDDTDTLIIEFEEGTLGDTGEQPSVNYTGDAVVDLAANKLRAFQGGGFAKLDGARPQVVEAYGDEGSTRLHVVFSEGVEGVTDPNTPSGPGRGLLEKDFSFTNGGGGNAGIVAVEHSKGDRTATLITASKLQAVDFGAAGDQVRPLPGHVRESNTKAAAQRLTVDQTVIQFVERDVVAPGAPTDFTWTPGQHNATLSFTAGWDDGTDAESGNVSGYHVVIASEPIPDGIDGAGVLALEAWPTIRLDPAPPAAGETQQKLIVENLCPGTTYAAAFVALDEDDNPSRAGLPGGFRTLDDDTPPTGTLTFLSTTHPLQDGEPIETAARSGRIAWTGLTDEESCGITYHWVIDNRPEGQAATSNNSTPEPGVNFTIPPEIALPADLYLHVAGANDQGIIGESHHFPLRITLPTDCDPGNITAPGLSAVHKDGFTTLTWQHVEKDLPEGIELEGYQVWFRKSAQSSWVLRELIEAPFSGFETLRYIDAIDAGSGSAYLVTAYFTDGLCRVAVDEQDLAQRAFFDFEPSSTEIVAPPPTVPTWAWVTLLAISLIVMGGVVVFYGARRTKLDESWLEDDPEETYGDPFGPDPIDDLTVGAMPVEDDPFQSEAAPSGDAPTLDISCPACTHQFQVSGHRPLQIRCPNCNASGVLE